MDKNRQLWNQQQQQLRQALAKPAGHERAMALFLSQHASMHSAEMSGAGLWSIEDEAWQGLSEAAARQIPAGFEHSILWLVWHLTRIEDITMNLLAADEPEVYDRENWQARLGIPDRDTGNLAPPETVALWSQKIDVPSLRAYRLTVGRRTRQGIPALTYEQLKQKVDPARLHKTLELGDVIPAAQGLLDYWGGLSVAGLLLMPPTRHNLIHWNEALKMKRKLK
jgi:hypothetical protein